MNLNMRIQNLAEHWGADLFGVADLSPAHGAILAQGGLGFQKAPWKLIIHSETVLTIYSRDI